MIYSREQTTFKLAHTIPAGTLVNGAGYSCDVTAYDILDNGITSSKLSFLCIRTPTWGFENVIPNQIIKNSSYDFLLHYSQEQNELLNEYKVTLYTSGLSVLFDTGILYGGVSPVNIGGLADNTLYYIRATGTTLNGIYLETEYIPFSVEYELPMLYSVITLDNKELEGLVKITSNIVRITGISSPEDIEYLDNEMVDLRSDGHSVTFNEGFNLDGNYLVEFLGFGFTQNKGILSLGTRETCPTIIWRNRFFYNDGGIVTPFAYAEIRDSSKPEYVIFSNKIENPLHTDMIHVWLRRVGGLYEIKIANKEVVV